ncbi:hypothetical protein ACH5RR_023788 [Cinchona calisaya]|uniref:Phosphoglycerate mutase family protein n=1 Tax=Cinchona calisaya TaxID=153742 RepID=A0ABD2ZBP3_9GENT
MGQSDGDRVQQQQQDVQLQKDEHSQQHVVVMRHGDRLDNFEPLWASKASRPWDPPLTQDGKDRAFARGRKFRTDRNRFHFPIDRIFVSPFLRCLQTAAEVVHGLCAVNDDDPSVLSSADITIDPSKIKVAVEYGLCEMLNTIAIRAEMVPKDYDFGFDISKCEAILPAGTIDHSVEPIYTEVPQWGESTLDARNRYVSVIKALADKYPSENLLLVTHGEAVGTSVSTYAENTQVSAADYCGYSHLSRTFFPAEDQSFTAGAFQVHIKDGENGLTYFGSSVELDST